MGCFVLRENTSSYEFALQSFVDFGYKLPDLIMTDQDEALTAAISKKWPTSVHLFCTWYIFRNIQKHVAKHLGKKNKIFLKDFTCIQRAEREEEFEGKWNSVLKKRVKHFKRTNVVRMFLILVALRPQDQHVWIIDAGSSKVPICEIIFPPNEKQKLNVLASYIEEWMEEYHRALTSF